MLDIRFIRENAELVQNCAKQKGFKIDVPGLLKIDESRRESLDKIQKLQKERNDLSRSIKARPPTDEEAEKGRSLKERIAPLEKNLDKIDKEFQDLHSEIPNVFPDDTPSGGEESSREEKKWGKIPKRNFEVVDHVTWADSQKRELLDFERGAKVAGNKFYYVEGSLVELEFALIQLGLKMAQEFKMDGRHNFRPMLAPHLVNKRIIEGAGFKAKSADEQQIYKIEGEDLYLIATAEIPLTGLHADEAMFRIPRFYAGFSPSYRVEAGAYGKHSKGLYRVHQFNKLELYVYCEGDLEISEKWHQKMLELEEKFVQSLEIPYRVVRIAAGDLGASAYKKYDIEYWSPVDNKYRELMSCSNVTDYQARRLNIRYKEGVGGPLKGYVHTLNGTLAATSRLMIAIIENFQTKEGEVELPKVLHPYMNGQTTL